MKLTLTHGTAALKDLVVSHLNARHDDPPTEAEADAMADSIEEIGLLQSLVVHKVKRSRKRGVLAGCRRLHGLIRLHARAPSAFDFDAIPVVIAEGTDAQLMQASTTENFAREPMTDAAIFRSVKRITDTGKTVTDEMLAHGFGVSLARMRRILRLAHVHPDILDTFAERGIEQRALFAYAGTADQELQKRVFDSLQGWQRNDESTIRRALGMADKGTREMLDVVGVDTYVAAGGAFEADLFVKDSGRVLHPDLLGQLYNDRLAAATAALQEQYPDRELTFGEPPQDRYGPDHRLKARAVPVIPAAISERIADLRESIHTLDAQIHDAIDWDACDEQGVDPDSYDLEASEAPWDLVPLHPHPDPHPKEIAAQLSTLRGELQDLERQAAAAPMEVPAAATHVHFTVRDGVIVPAFWYPTAKAAGFTTRNGGATTAITSGSGASTPADPAEPSLTGRADFWLKAARVSMAMNHILSDGEAAAATRGRAHKALIFAHAHRLRFSMHSRVNYGLVYNFEGTTYNYSGSGHDAPDVSTALAGIPGLSEQDAAAGFLVFEQSATPEQVDLCAAIVFAKRIDGNLRWKGSLADEVMVDLAHPPFARSAWTPTREFFDLFRKATILAWTALFKNGFNFGDMKVADLKTAAVDFFTGGTEAVERYQLTPEVADEVRGWLPPWLRWASASELAAERVGAADTPTAARIAERTTPDAPAPSAVEPAQLEPVEAGEPIEAVQGA